MAERVVIDPITRIEGHLRIEADIENGMVTDAYSSGTAVRGIELIVKDRDPRDVWAFVGRVCGVCTSVHSLCSVRAMEDAFKIMIPPNAEMVRNMMNAALFMHDHVVHFYQLQAFDWVDVVSALKADPNEASAVARNMSDWPNSSPGYFKDIQKKIQALVNSGQLGIFTNGYWGHPAYKLNPEQNLVAVAHYLEALEWQKDIVRVQTVFGGKNPHPNYLVGGMACAINTNGENAINTERLSYVLARLQNAHDFVNKVFLPDLKMIGAAYRGEWWKVGGGVTNYLTCGDFPMSGYNVPSSYKMKGGVVLNRDLSKVYPLDPNDPKGIQEFVTHSWYKYAGGNDVGLHPYQGETDLNYTGPKPPYTHLNVEDKYSWIKTPRWHDKPMEVGPLARLIVNYAAGQEEVVAQLDQTLKDLDLPFDAIYSTLGRVSARALECALISNWALEFHEQLITNLQHGDMRMMNNTKWEPKSWDPECQGMSFTEAPRGALSHWAVIKGKKVSNYQMVVPTTWNASPRDPQGQRSPYEASLIGTPVAIQNQPLEILRTIHSFDPCLSCSVHLYDEEGSHVHQVKTM